MPEVISMDKLREMNQQGAQIEFAPRHVQIEELGRLVGELKRAADANESISQNGSADALKQLVEAVAKLKLEAPAVDLKPLSDSLRYLAETLAPKPVCPARYTFTVQRNNRGQIETVVAEPDKAVDQ